MEKIKGIIESIGAHYIEGPSDQCKAILQKTVPLLIDKSKDGFVPVELIACGCATAASLNGCMVGDFVEVEGEPRVMSDGGQERVVFLVSRVEVITHRPDQKSIRKTRTS